MSIRSLAPTGLVCLCAGALYGWSALLSPLEVRYNATMAQGGLVFSLALASFTAAVILAPRLFHDLAQPRLLAGFGIAGALCLALAPLAGGYWGFTALFSGGFGALSGAIYIAALAAAARHSQHHIATPVMVAAFGLGGAVFGPLWRVLVAQDWGLETLWPLAACLCAAALWNLTATAPAPPPAPARAAPERATQNTTLALIWLTFAFGSFGGLMVLGMASKILDAQNTGIALASATLAGLAVANTCGRLGVAWLSGRVRLRGCLALSIALGVLGLLAMTGSATTLSLSLILIAASYGLMAATIPMITRAAFGAAAFPVAFSLIFTAWGLAGLVAPWLAGAVFDVSGDFATARGLALASTGLCAVSALLLIRRLQRMREPGSLRSAV